VQHQSKAAVESYPTVCATSKIVGHFIHKKKGPFAKLRKVTINVTMSVSSSVRLYGTTWLPLNVFLLSLILEYFLKICLKNWSFITIQQK